MNAITSPKGKAEEKESPSEIFRKQLEQRLDTFAEALPPHITPQRFKSTISWAVMADPGLLAADRVSLFEACLAAANDGLMPDKKEGALVVYNTKLPKQNRNDRDVWIKKVQWLPMVRGVLTKIYNTGKVKSADVGIVYGGDAFRYWKDDAGEHLEHEPAENPDKSIVRRVYARVIMKESEGGGVFAEVLDVNEVEKIKAASKTSDRGPWVDWWDQMAVKSAIKRLAKRLPIARDIEQVLARDNFMYDLDLTPAIGQRRPMPSLAGRLDALASGAQAQLQHQPGEGVPFDAETGEAGETEPARKSSQAKQQAGDQRKSSETAKPPAPEDSEASGPDVATGSDAEGAGDADPMAAAFAEGQKARADGLSRKAVPAAYRNDERLLEAYLGGFDQGS